MLLLRHRRAPARLAPRHVIVAVAWLALAACGGTDVEEETSRWIEEVDAPAPARLSAVGLDHPDAIEPAWLTEVLRANGCDAEVASLRSSAVGTGQMADNYRLHLEFTQRDAATPEGEGFGDGGPVVDSHLVSRAVSMTVGRVLGWSRQTLDDSFSSVSRPIFASKY